MLMIFIVIIRDTLVLKKMLISRAQAPTLENNLYLQLQLSFGKIFQLALKILTLLLFSGKVKEFLLKTQTRK